MANPGPEILGLGAETKVRLSLLADNGIEQSPVFSDLRDFQVFQEYRKAVRGYLNDRRISTIACDRHPDYLSARFASELASEKPLLRLVRVQHHFSHLVSVLWENGLDEDVVGVVFDGTGYGDDGQIWGGEVFRLNRSEYTRMLHLESVEMPGLDSAVREPWRMAASWISKLGLKENHPLVGFLTGRIGPERWNVVGQMIASATNSIKTSSMGRLFDAVSSLLGICDVNSSEAEAAIKLEKSADPSVKQVYPFSILGDRIILTEMMLSLVEDAGQKPVSFVSAVFHNTVAQIVFEAAKRIADETRLDKIAVSGGVFQNRLLNAKLDKLFADSKLTLFKNKALTPTDLNISAGQAVHAARV